MDTDHYKILHSYEDLGQYLMMDEISGDLCLKKYPEHHEESVYKYLQEHRHSHIPAVFEFGTDDKGFYVIEEYIKGKTLTKYLEQNKTASEERRRILDEILEGLEFLHSAEPPIIHRDLKGDNILVDKSGKVFLIDYDAAKTYKPGAQKDTELIGTVGTAAPEQYGFTQSDQRTDIYALGLIIKEMFPNAPKYQAVAAHATRFDPERRYGSVAELRRDLNRRKGSVLFLRRWAVPISVVALALVLIFSVWFLGRAGRSSSDDPSAGSAELSAPTSMIEGSETTENTETVDTDGSETEDAGPTNTSATESSPGGHATYESKPEETTEDTVVTSTSDTATEADTSETEREDPIITTAPTATPTLSTATTAELSPTSTSKPTATPTPKPTATSTPKPTATPTPKPTLTPTPQPNAVSPGPTDSAPVANTATPTNRPAATNTVTPVPTSTDTPTPTPTESATALRVEGGEPIKAEIVFDGDNAGTLRLVPNDAYIGNLKITLPAGYELTGAVMNSSGYELTTINGTTFSIRQVGSVPSSSAVLISISWSPDTRIDSIKLFDGDYILVF